MAEDFVSDQVVLIADNPIQHASIGSTVEFYARLANLTMRDIKIAGVAHGMTQIKHGQFLNPINTMPQVVQRLSVSDPIHVLSVVFNPEHFNKIESVHVAQVQLVIIGPSGGNVPVVPALWRVDIRDVA